MNVRLKRARELAGYAVQLTRDEGLPTMLKRGAGFVKRRCFGKRARYLPAKKVLEAQRAEMAGKTAADCGLPTISILTPLYNTPEKYLREFLDSFVNQTAPNGQLCLADASDAEHADVKRIVEEYQTKNQRIVYKKIENKGIAANTNAAAELATGEYLALADHDDILAPHAMYTMGKAILQLRALGEPDGFLYSDEALFSKSIQRPMVAHFKPDYAPDYLLCCNYICHLAVFQKALWDEIGGERPECDAVRTTTCFCALWKRPAARPMCAGAVLLAGARRLHLRRHRCQALCGGSSQKGAGRPSGPHRAHRHRGGWPVPQYLPGEVGYCGRPEGKHPHPEQGPHRRSGKVPAQHLDQNQLGEL